MVYERNTKLKTLAQSDFWACMIFSAFVERRMALGHATMASNLLPPPITLIEYEKKHPKKDNFDREKIKNRLTKNKKKYF